ncbi:hypothetical protein ACFWEO_18205 [Streptomyces roseolus]|uniref:hypothetical protein n=1 Tax=Streptomyces roseolus TaxID=67358 RepID=UPI00362B0AAF
MRSACTPLPRPPNLLDRLGDALGLRAGFHPALTLGVWLLGQTDRPYDDAVGPLDRIDGTVITASVFIPSAPGTTRG